MIAKTIVCLANSFRPGGSCVAGIELEDGRLASWIRPISHRQNQAISDLEKTYADNTQLSVLDVVEITFDEHRPEYHQTENWLISEGISWRKVGRATQAQLASAVLPSNSPLWRPATSTYTGVNDEISAIVAERLNTSLALVQPQTANVNVSHNPFSGKNEVWISFNWAGTGHKIKLTDPVQFERFNTTDGDSYSIANPMLCISLTLVWEKRKTASKVVAGLIT